MFVWINRWDLIHIRNTCATCVLNIWYILTFYVRNNVILSLIYYIILHQLNYICWFLLKLQYNARKKWDDTIMIHKACHVYFLFASHSQKRRSRPLFSLPIWNYHLTWSMLIFGWAHLIVAHLHLIHNTQHLSHTLDSLETWNWQFPVHVSAKILFLLQTACSRWSIAKLGVWSTPPHMPLQISTRNP